MRKLTFLILFSAISVTALAETPKGTIPVVTLEQATPVTTKTETKKVTTTRKPVVKKVKTVSTPATTTAVEPIPATVTTPAPSATVTTTTKKTKTVKTAKPAKVKVAKVKKEKTPKVKTAKITKVKKEKPIKTALKEKTLSSGSGQSHALKGSVTLGLSGTAFLDFGSEEGMYLSAADKTAIVAAGGTVQSITAGGIGGNISAEYGFSDRWSGTLSAGLDRLTYANHFKSVVTESFFAVDAVANYYFLQDPKVFMPYVSAGVGLVAGSTKTLPTLDVGAGAHIFVSDNVSIKAQLLAKAAFIFNRLQPSVGVAYHFK